eukprot:66291_1
MESLSLAYLLLLAFLALTTSQTICNDDRECYNGNVYCDDPICSLQCNGTQSCANLNYKCNSTDPSSTCSIQCNGYESCKSIHIYSSATVNELHCMDWPSCIDANVHCNSSHTNHSSCSIDCTSARSCQSLSFYCSPTVSICSLNCENEADSCENINYDCEASATCEYNCPNQDIESNDYYCSNLNCPQCDASSTTTSSTSTTAATTTTSSSSTTSTVVIAETQNFTGVPIEKEMEMIDPSKLSSPGYHVVFGFLFCFAMIYILHCMWMNRSFFSQVERIDGVFSLLPMILFFSFYQTLSCWIMGGTATYLSFRFLSVGAYFWSIFIPLQLLIIISHILIWYLYLIYYGKNPSLNYLYFIASRLSPKYPRSLYFIPQIFLLVWSFVVMVIAYSIASTDPLSATGFVAIIVILESVCGMAIAFKLISIAITYVQMQYVLSSHEDTTMKLVFSASVSVLCVFLAIFVMGLCIWDVDNGQFQSYVADVMRVFQLMLELFFILLCAILFFYMTPSPQLHASHQASFIKVYHANCAYLDEDDDEEEMNKFGFVTANIDAILVPHTPVFVYNKEQWILARVHKLGSENTVCFVTTEEQKTQIIIDLHGEEHKQYIKLAIFGVNPAILETDYDHKYALKDVPVVLMSLRDKLFELGGHLTQGIFRKEADKTQYNSYKLCVEQERMDVFDDDECDVHIVSNLIKDFYRSMPAEHKVLQSFDFIHNDINNEVMLLRDMKLLLNDKNQNYQFGNSEHDMSKVLVMWLWSLCADCIQFSSTNKMSVDSFAIVISPNLYHHQGDDPKQYMQMQHRLHKFCALGIQYMVHKQQQRQRKSMSSMTSIPS